MIAGIYNYREARTMKNKPLAINLFLIAAAVAVRSGAQTTQSHPELCGRPDASIPVPDGVRWQPLPNSDTFTSTLFLQNRDGGESGIDLETWPSMDQICPIPGDQLVLFGKFNDNYGIERINRTTAAVIDIFEGRNPMMSPNQHWLIMRPYRHFRSQRSNSEEYMLYDLTVDAAKNRMPGLTALTGALTGRPVYPVPNDGMPFDFEDQPPEVTHEFQSDAFHWAPDSSTVVFADSVMDRLSIVVVQIQPNGPTTLVLPVDVSGICKRQVDDSADYAIPTLTGIDFASSESLVVNFETSPSCKSTQMTLFLRDFQKPKPEVHVPPKMSPAPLNGVQFN